jgi:hypothetical protein
MRQHGVYIRKQMLPCLRSSPGSLRRLTGEPHVFCAVVKLSVEHFLL